MTPDTPQAEPPTPPLPWSRLNVTPPLPVEELRNDELELLVGSRALFARGQPPDVQVQVNERIRQAWAELNRRGVHKVAVTHWNFGKANEKPIDPSLYDEHWYKRPMPENHTSPDPVRDLAREQMLPTTMHGTRPLLTILDTRHGAGGAACDDDRWLMARLGEKVLNYLHKLAL